MDQLHKQLRLLAGQEPDSDLPIWTGRRVQRLLRILAAMPLTLVGISILFGTIMLVGPSDRINTWYAQHGMRAINGRNFQVARICYEGLLQHDPSDSGYQLGLAISLAGLDEKSEAMVLINRLAPENAEGYPPAHLFFAQQLLLSPSPSDALMRSAETHLLRVVQAQPTNIQAHAMLAGIYERSGRWEQVREHLSQGGPLVDEIGLAAAKSFAAQGDAVEADAWARRATRYYRNRIMANPRDTASRLKLAESLLMVREFASAIELLETAWKDTRDPACATALAEVSAAWLRSAAGLSAGRRMSLLQRGLSWDPQNRDLLEMVLDPVIIGTAGQITPTTMPVEGTAARSLCQAVAAARANQPSEIRAQLAMALTLDEVKMPAVVANVACIWAYGQSADAECSLLLSSALVQLRPQDAIAQRAQGLVLAKQGRWNLASKHLEAAMKAMPGDQVLRGVLASAYDQMGMPAAADEQRRVIEAQVAAASRAGTDRAATQPAASH